VVVRRTFISGWSHSIYRRLPTATRRVTDCRPLLPSRQGKLSAPEIALSTLLQAGVLTPHANYLMNPSDCAAAAIPSYEERISKSRSVHFCTSKKISKFVRGLGEFWKVRYVRHKIIPYMTFANVSARFSSAVPCGIFRRNFMPRVHVSSTD